MRSNYRRIGDFIRPVKVKNADGLYNDLQGINIDKFFMPSVANTVGVDLKKYKIIKQGQFACNRMHVGRDYRIPIALSDRENPFIVSPAYDVFEIKDKSVLLPEYLMMWFSRKEFDRNAWFYTDADVRGGLPWKSFCDIELPIPSIEKQREIVKEYNTVVNRIKLNEQLNQKLEETAQALYKHWFVDFEFPNENSEPYKSSGGAMVYNEELDKEIPEGWELGNLHQIAKIIMGQSPSGESYNNHGEGEIFYQGRTDFGFRYPSVRMYTTQPKRKALFGDVLMSVRAPVGDVNIANSNCCIGRGIASIRHYDNYQSFLYYLMQEVRNQFDVSNDEGTIFGSITKDGLHEITVIKPDKNIIKYFNDQVSKIDSHISNLCVEIEYLNELKSLILSKMTKVEQEKEVIN